MKTLRYALFTLLALAPGLASAQPLYADSLDIVIGGVVFPAIAPSWTLLLEEGETYGPFDLSVAEPDIACTPNDDAGDPLITNPDEVAGTVVIVARGSCNFTTKVTAAFNAGAAGIILYSATTPTTPDAFPAIGGAPEASTQLRSAFVSYNTGIAALDAAGFGDQVTFIQRFTSPVPENPPNVELSNGTVQTSLYGGGVIGRDAAANYGFGFAFEGGGQPLYAATFLLGVDGDVNGNPYADPEYTSVTEPFTLDAGSIPAPFDAGARTVFTSPLGFEVELSAYADEDATNQDFVVFEASVTNTSDAAIDDVYLGMFADWDIGGSSTNDLAGYDDSQSLLYVYDPTEEGSPYVGVAAIGGDVSGYNTTATAPTDAQLFGSMTMVTDTSEAGAERATALGVGPFSFDAGETMTRRFAFIGGTDLADLQANAAAAQQLPVSIQEETTPQGTFVLKSAYPNPAASRATIGFELPVAQNVRLAVYDVLGREVAVLVDSERQAGPQTAQFDVSSLSSGMYIYRLEAGTTRLTQTITVVR